MAALSLKGVTKTYSKTEVIHATDLHIEPGEFIVFVGPSGCGKSTLLRVIAGLEEVSSGAVYIGEDDVTNVEASKRGIAMVFQSYALYPHMTVRENLSFGLKNMKLDTENIKQQVDRAADILKLSKYLDRLPSQLSGGQRQRVAIGRAIVRNPKLFLFDEPLSNLDVELRVEMRRELKNMHRLLGSTMIYVTHDQVEAMTMADRIAVLNDGELVQIAPPLDIYNKPKNMFVAGFIGSPKMNFINGKVVSIDSQALVVGLSGEHSLSLHGNVAGLAVGDHLTIGVRPEHVVKGVLDNALVLQLTLNHIESLGDATYVYSTFFEEQEFVVKLEGQHCFNENSCIDVSIKRDRILLFDSSGELLEFQ